MKYFRVNGGEIFPFYLPRITSHNVHLLEKYDTQKESFSPVAEQNLRTVQSACTQLAKPFGLAYSTEICLRTHTAHVCVFLPLWYLTKKEIELLWRLKPYLAGIDVHPFGFGLRIIFKIKYFGDEAEHVEKNMKEILLNYTENKPL